MTASKYLRTGAMAKFVGRSSRWLKSRKGTVFEEGVHYHQKPGEKEPFWDVRAIEAWIRGETVKPEVEKLVRDLVSSNRSVSPTYD